MGWGGSSVWRHAIAFGWARAAVLVALALMAGGAAASPFDHRYDLTAEDRARIAVVTRPATSFAAPEPFEAMAGGAGTSLRLPDRNAFDWPGSNLPADHKATFSLGEAVFDRLWVSAPSSTQSVDGLGPLFAARSCQACHARGGGGSAPANGAATGFTVGLAVPLPGGGAGPEPVYGEQLQDAAVAGVKAEGRITVAWANEQATMPDGTSVSLRKPSLTITDLGYGPLKTGAMTSLRVAPRMIGLGLIEAIDQGDILARADPDDHDGNGISGRPNWIVAASDTPRLGRFGWKAGTADLQHQVARAFSLDMGLSTTTLPSAMGDCTEAQTECLAAPSGVQARFGPAEVSAVMFDLALIHTRSLAVPARRDVADPEVLAGKRIFMEAGCAGCHTPKFVTRRDAPDPAARFQLIWPYSDLLLHDMGPALADGRPEAGASGTEWRTTPLWGLGLAQAVNGNAGFLHDGRARTPLEAVLWHGGEAAPSRDHVLSLDKADKARLLAFLTSL